MSEGRHYSLHALSEVHLNKTYHKRYQIVVTNRATRAGSLIICESLGKVKWLQLEIDLEFLTYIEHIVLFATTNVSPVFRLEAKTNSFLVLAL